MDLNKIKDTWQNTEIKVRLNEEKIQQMVSSKGQSAFSKLKYYENLELIVFPFIILLNITFIAAVQYLKTNISIILPTFTAGSCFCFWIWSIYKFRFLKKVNLIKMNIIDIVKAVDIYKKYMRKEYIIILVWITIFAILCVWQTSTLLTLEVRIMIGIVVWAITILATNAAYTSTTKKHLKQIEKEIDKTKSSI